MSITWKLTKDQRAEFLKKEEQRLNDTEELSIYNTFVEQQKGNFILVIEGINNIINDLKRNGKISDYIQFRARIKAPQSAIQNDKTKALDDIFGIEIITGIEDEIDVIEDELKKYVKVWREKIVNKDNGYKARHFLYSIKPEAMKKFKVTKANEEYVPAIECQIKTLEVYIKCNGGTADHTIYKNGDMKLIQKKYDAGRI